MTMRANAPMGLVRRLLMQEAGDSQDPDALVEAAERAADRLRVHLSQRIGQEGFRTLLARALTLAAVQFPHLSAARVAPDGSLVGLHGDGGEAGMPTSVTPQEALAGATALVAHFLSLLVIFIGEELTLRLLSAVWPQLANDGTTVWEKTTP